MARVLVCSFAAYLRRSWLDCIDRSTVQGAGGRCAQRSTYAGKEITSDSDTNNTCAWFFLCRIVTGWTHVPACVTGFCFKTFPLLLSIQNCSSYARIIYTHRGGAARKPRCAIAVVRQGGDPLNHSVFRRQQQQQDRHSWEKVKINKPKKTTVIDVLVGRGGGGCATCNAH